MLAADAMFIKAVQLSKEGKPKEAAKLLIEHAVGEKELPMKLASVQVLLSQDERKDAIAILENLNERDRSLPGIVSALVTLHLADHDREKASVVLKNAVAYYKKNKVYELDIRIIISSARHFFIKLHKKFSFRKLLKIWENCGDKLPIFIYAVENSRLRLTFCKN